MAVALGSPPTLARLASARGLNRSQVSLEPSGLVTQSRRRRLSQVEEPLTLHAEWAGPTKLVGTGGDCRQRWEVFLGDSHLDDDLLDEHASAEFDGVLGELIDQVFSGAVVERVEDWQPPEAGQLAAWLADASYTTAIDEEQNLRLTLKARGADGQVKIVRQSGRLRMVLGLGTFPGLDRTAERAMLRLAREANAAGRIVRIAWREEGSTRRCEAQADLSGLPVGPGRVRDELWRGMLRMSVGGLELALRRLGMELEVLADSRQRALAQRLAGPDEE